MASNGTKQTGIENSKGGPAIDANRLRKKKKCKTQINSNNILGRIFLMFEGD